MSDDTQEVQSFMSLVKATPAPAGPDGAAPVAPNKGKSHMTKAQRAECTMAWRLGTASPKDLAKRFNVTERAIYAYFKARNIKHGDLANRQVKAAEEVATVDPKIQAQRVKDTKDETYKLLTWIRKLIQNELVKTTQAGKSIGSVLNEIRTLKEAAAAVKVTREEIYVLLGIKEGDLGSEDLPELRIRGLSEDEILQLQQENQDDLEGDLAIPSGIEELPPDDGDIDIESEEEESDEGPGPA